jgi:glyoxylate reductase
MPKYRVFVTSQHQGNAIALLSPGFEVSVNQDKPSLSPTELLNATKGNDAVVCLPEDLFSEAVLSACPDLKLIATVSVGFNNVDVPAATRRGILVTNTPGVLSETTADLAFALLIACARRIAEGDRYVRDRQWKGFSPALMLGVDVYGKTLGIVGYGRIGQAMARRGLGFGMNVLYVKRSGSDDNQAKVDGEPWGVRLEELLSNSDFISLHCPLTKETHHLIGKRELSLMKRDAILINTARGAVVDQLALIEVLRAGNLRGAGLDVFEDEPNVPEELIGMNNVVLTPHIGSASIETRSAMANLAVQSVLSAFAGKLPANSVNPEVWPKFSDSIKAKSVPG